MPGGIIDRPCNPRARQVPVAVVHHNVASHRNRHPVGRRSRVTDQLASRGNRCPGKLPRVGTAPRRKAPEDAVGDVRTEKIHCYSADRGNHLRQLYEGILQRVSRRKNTVNQRRIPVKDIFAFVIEKIFAIVCFDSSGDIVGVERAEIIGNKIREGLCVDMSRDRVGHVTLGCTVYGGIKKIQVQGPPVSALDT